MSCFFKMCSGDQVFMLAGRPHRNAQPPDRFGDLVFFSDRAGVLDMIPAGVGVSDGRRNRVGE